VDPTKQEGKHAKYVWKLPETPRCANDLFS